MQLRHIHIKVPATEASSGISRTLIALLAAKHQCEAGGFDEMMVYLHGFPDMSVHPTKVDFASRVPTRLSEFWLNQQHETRRVAFMTFNFGGIPGSDSELQFTDKTISQEVEDVVAVCKHIRSSLLKDKGRVHVVGLSTGAIVGALLREKQVCDTITVIAGLLDLTTGVHFDFNTVQLEQISTRGWCWKEFYLPEGCPEPRDVDLSLDGINPTTGQIDTTTSSKIYVRLDRRYVAEYTDGSLNIPQAVSRSASPPLLVIHGDADQDVPFPNGAELFAAAAEPKTFVAIPHANHMLSNSKHLKKALRAIGDHTRVAHLLDRPK
uniref:AB hydrolase-1 domain-containing protein n=1 Tax=Peronospora matthiolae TaxID=2874970 RepID=A0AAV1VJP8_9STRA